MKKAVLLTLLTFALAIPALADDDDRHQSYLSYDDGGTIVRSGEDGREIEAHRNLPIYPGDEVVTARRGRAEVRLSDGNIVGIDRASALLFRSMLDAYDGDGNETVIELKYGKVAVHRTDIGRDHVRLDTDNASYVAEHEGVYSVETDSRGRDRVTVFDGSLEVRTPTRATRLRQGEAANVDDRGVFDLIGDQRLASDDFERWFLQRAERFGTYSHKYMDRRQAYWSDDLDDHGRWVFVTGIGWSWRPLVAVGWRPYYNGYWYNRGGGLTWVSYDPWGWGTYHYGRWAFDPGYGWVWVPGYGYSPAWVYWMYGSGYVGWAPAGWWDCYRPYYSWAYNPYRHYGHRYGFGFYGRVRVSDLDLRPWTFVDSRGIISSRVDRAALTADAVKQRLGRNRDGYATVGGGPARFTREEWNDPAEAVRRRGLDGRRTGAETGSGGVGTVDMTPFFRRDGDVGGPVRDRVIRARSGSGSGSSTGGVPSRNIGGGAESVAPIGRGSVAPIGGGNVAPIGRGSVAPIGRGTGDTSSGRVNRRGTTPPPASQPADSGSSSGTVGRGRDRDAGTPSESDTPRSSGPSWRDRARERDTQATPPTTSTNPPSGESSGSSSSAWRNRIPDRGGERRDTSGSGSSTSSGSSNAPSRRVIDSVGGARIRPRDSGDSSSSSGKSSSSGRSSGSVDRGSRSSGGSSGGGSSTRSSGGSSSGSSSGGSSSTRSSDGGGRSSRGDSGGGRVKRD
ncbi:MAG: DUF6600 domain-containing protein [Thermoanaerobaculia bacterium]